jgi:WD40 repeat protein
MAFSSTGHLLAAASAAVITLYKSMSREAVSRLKGHLSSVTALSWSADDRILLSASLGGTVYFWDVASQSRLRELDYIDKSCTFASLHLMRSGNRAVARSSEGSIHLIDDGACPHALTTPASAAGPMQLVANDGMVLAGSDDGNVLSWPWPQALPAAAMHQEASTTAAHASAVRHVRAAGNGSLLITAAEDGVVLVWSLQVLLSTLLCLLANSCITVNCIDLQGGAGDAFLLHAAVVVSDVARL